ncbi:MAG: three-Cys-motif partner protein TcmP [Pirellulaceae bacterium]
MSHKANENFFATKRHWSQRKDEILKCYLTAYLPKILRVGKPVLIVDGFAGPGRFHDGQAGSPIIIAECVIQTLAKNLQSRQEIGLWCIEKTIGLFNLLEENLTPIQFAKAKSGEFGDYASQISQAAKTQSVFLYVDPFTVEGLDWNQLDQIFQGLGTGNSVEVLLNLNSASFVRRGLSVLKCSLKNMDGDADSSDPVDQEIEETPTLEALNSIAGGVWWRQLILNAGSFPEAVAEFTGQFCVRLKNRFKHVVYHPIKAMPHHQVAKYYLVFGTRHIDGLTLMNDEMVKSRRVLADMAKPKEALLFEKRSEELVPDLERLPSLILARTQIPFPRGDVIDQIIENEFCQFHRTEIRGCIEELLKSGKLASETKKTKINDDCKIWVQKK